MKSTMTKYKHLTLSDRNDIQLGLERGETFKAIGQLILKDPTTVSKEVKRNRQVRESTCDNLPCPLLDKAPLSVMDALKEDKTVAIRKSSISLNKLKSSTNKLLSKLVKGFPSIPRPSGTWTKSFPMVLKRDNTSIISSKLTTLMSAPQPSIDISEKDTYLSLLLI